MEGRVVLVLLILTVVNSAWSTSSICPMQFYRELGCEPVNPEEGAACPTQYKCPEFHPNPNLCYYKGVSYEPGDLIPDENIVNPCSINCRCNILKTPSVSYDSEEKGMNSSSTEIESTFMCAAIDCVENFDSGVEDEEECVRTYSLDSCCGGDDTICGKDEINKLTTCELDGKTYRQGEKMYPDGCLVCLCTPEYNGTYEGAPYCSSIDCGVEIHHQMDLANKCAPVVLSGPSCCPHAFECPDNSTTVIRATNYERSDDKSNCQFGDMTLRVGDQVDVNNKCIKCSCQVPPMVSCVQEIGCSN